MSSSPTISGPRLTRPAALLGRLLSILALLSVALLSPRATSTARADTAAPKHSVGLALFLDEEGTLHLPPEGIAGSLDASGYQMVSAPGEPPRFAPTDNGVLATAADNANWDGRFTLPGPNNYVFALAWDGANLYVGGWFNSASGLPAECIVRWDGNAWSSLGTGMNGPVNALLWEGGFLYAGGAFTLAGGLPANRVARWDGNNWSALGSGIGNGVVYALGWDGGNLYAGGSFTNPGNRIARWNGSTWSPMGSGMDSGVSTVSDFNAVYALAWDGSGLYAGGIFTNAGGLALTHLARWDGNAWSAPGNSPNNYVWALLWANNALYVGGEFTQIGGISANRLARYNGTWSSLGSGANAGIWALTWDGTDLYAGGGFTSAGGVAANRIARWNGTAWSALGSGFNNYVNTLFWNGTSLYSGGDFTAAGNLVTTYLARWDGAIWNALGSGGQAVSGMVFSLAWSGGNLYAGGDFMTAGGVPANAIARWDGTAWNPLGTGIDNRVLALVADGTSLYAAGAFSIAGGLPANRVARWNGSTWSSLGSGLNGTVRALAWDGSNLYVGGDFTLAGGSAANRVARWNGSTWSSLGSGLNGTVRALAWDGSNLYAGGDFTLAGGSAANRLARWNGSTWSPLGNGTDGTVRALAWDGTRLYAGGDFSAAGGTPAAHIARWDGGTWASLSGGTSGNIYALAWDGASLFAAGDFSTPAQRIARWNGNTWSALGGGLSGQVKPITQTPPTNSVYALAWESGGLYSGVWAGGAFATAGPTVTNAIARWRQAAIWDGGGGDQNAANPANWNNNALPTSRDVLLFDQTSANAVTLGAGFPSILAGMVIENGYTGIITQTASLHLNGQFILRGGTYVVPDPNSATLSVSGAIVHTGGTLRQKRPVEAAQVTFLQLEDGAGGVRYRGVEVDSTPGGANLGPVTVSIRVAGAEVNSYCPPAAANVPVYGGRCYEITPTFAGPAHLRLWGLASELSTIPVTSLAIYHHDGGSGWVELNANRIDGDDGGDYRFSEGDTLGFSPFLLGLHQAGPTAVIVQHFSGQAENTASDLLPGAGLLACILGVAVLRGRRRR